MNSILEGIYWRKWLKIAVLILAVGFYASYAAQNFANIPTFQWSAAAIATGFMSVILVVFVTSISGVIWLFLLRDHGFRPSWQQTQVIFAITQFGKYLPGNIGQYLGRVFIAREIGIPASVTANTMLIEILWGVGAGAGLTLISLIFFVDSRALGFQFGPLELALVIALLMFLPWFIVNLLNRFAPSLAKRLSGGGLIKAPRLITALVVALIFLVNFGIMGVILKFQAVWFFDVTGGSIFQLTCLFAVAWVAGYIVPGAPGGLGVREAMMVLVLSPVLGPGAATGLSLTLRLTTILGDAAAFAMGIIGRKYVAYNYVK